MPSDEEIIKLIVTLITKYAPPGLDKMTILDRIAFANAEFLVPDHKKPKCKKCQTVLSCEKCAWYS